jgi:uncharacterized membrane protein YccC
LVVSEAPVKRASFLDPPKSRAMRLVWGVLIAIVIGGGIVGKLAPPLWLNWLGLAVAGVAAFALWVVAYIDRGHV